MRILLFSFFFLCPFFVSKSFALIELNARALYAINSSSYVSGHSDQDTDKKGLGFGVTALIGIGPMKMGLDLSYSPIVDGTKAGINVSGKATSALLVAKLQIPYLYGMAGLGISKIKTDYGQGGPIHDDHHYAPSLMLAGGLQFGNFLYGIDIGLRYTLMAKSKENVQQLAPSIGVYLSI